MKLRNKLEQKAIAKECADWIRRKVKFKSNASQEEMGEYGENFSKVERHFLEAAVLARNNERNVKGIVINAFTEPFVVPREMFEVIANMESSIQVEGEDNE